MEKEEQKGFVLMNDKEKKLEDLEKFLSSKRSEWTSRIREIIKGIRNVEKLEDDIALMLSYRQMLVEEVADLNSTIFKNKKSYNVLQKHKYISYYKNDYKWSDKQKNMMLKSDLAIEIMQIQLLDSQLEFFKECIQTLDKMGWAAKVRVDLENI